MDRIGRVEGWLNSILVFVLECFGGRFVALKWKTVSFADLF